MISDLGSINVFEFCSEYVVLPFAQYVLNHAETEKNLFETYISQSVVKFFSDPSQTMGSSFKEIGRGREMAESFPFVQGRC